MTARNRTEDFLKQRDKKKFSRRVKPKQKPASKGEYIELQMGIQALKHPADCLLLGRL